MINYLLKETESSIISELCDNVENENKAIINANVDSEQLGIVFTTKDFNEILKESRKASPVLDNTCSKLLKELLKNVKALACLVFCSCNNNLYVPVIWKEAQIKKNQTRRDRAKAKNYWSISLTYFITKICKTAVKNFVMVKYSQSKVGETTSSYRKHRCTADNLIKLTQHVSEAFQWSEIFGLVCLDVEKVFDAVWCLGRVYKLNLIALHFGHKVDQFVFIAKEVFRDYKLHFQW